MADFLVSQGRSDEAKTALSRILEIAVTSDDKWPAQKKLAQIIKAQGHPKEAVIYYQDALKNAPLEASCEIGLDLGELYETQGDVANASLEYNRVAERCKDNPLFADKAHDKLKTTVTS